MDITAEKGELQKNIEVFCCYARKDRLLLKELKNHLVPLIREGLITLWADTDINAGTEWEKEIHLHLNTSRIILLLVSPDFMASDYCYSIEMTRAMERHESGEAQVIPIILRPVFWQKTPFGKLQALPTDGKPVASQAWSNKDEAFYITVVRIRSAVETRIAKEEQLRNAEEAKEARSAKQAEQARLAEEKRRQKAERLEQTRIAKEEQLRKAEEAKQTRVAEERRYRDKEAQLRATEIQGTSVPGPNNNIFSSLNSPNLSLSPKLSRRTMLIGLVGLSGAAGGITLFTHWPKATGTFSGKHNSYIPSPPISKKGLLISNSLQWGSDYVSGAPYVFQDPANPNKLIGFEVEIVQAIANLMGITQTQVEISYDKLEQALAANQFDMVINGWEKTAGREKTELFSDPYYRYGQQIIVRKDDTRFANVVNPTSIKVLEGYTVGTGSGYLAQTIMQGDSKINIKTYDGNIAFSDLVQKKVDAFFLDSPLATLYVAGTSPDAQLKLLGQPLYPDNYYMAINPHRNEASALLSEINKAIAELKKNGTLRHIYQKWGLWNNEQNAIGII